MAKMSLIFKGFDDMMYRLDAMDGDIKKAANEALEETQGIVSANLKSGAAPYAKGGRKGYATGAMYSAIKTDKNVKWAGDVATVDVGFQLTKKGGWHSIFVMYGTPRMSKDPKVYNAVRGAKTRREIAEKQKEVMRKYLSMGKRG